MDGRTAAEVLFSAGHETAKALAGTGILRRGPAALLAVPRGDLPRLILNVDRASDRLPLELIGCVALERPVARLFADLPPREPRTGRRRTGRLRLLLAGTRSPRPGLTWLDDEAEFLARFLADRAEVRRWRAPDGGWRAVIDSFHRAAAGMDAIHFYGHAEAGRDGAGGAWSFQLDGERDYWLHPREIGLLGIGKPPELIVSNTCGAADGTEMARQAMQAGVKAFIQPAIPLSDNRGWELAAAIYRRLADGGEIGDAVLAARRSAAGRNSMLWAVLRLYGDPRWRFPHESLVIPSTPA